MEFTGEFFVPEMSGKRIEADHMERYRFASTFAKNSSVLDIACGTGYSAPLFIEAGARNYTGVDINEDLVNHARGKYQSEKVHYLHGDICQYTDHTKYDLIVCFETIEHVKEYKMALQNLFRHLKKNGLLFVSSPNRPVTSPLAASLTDKPGNRFHTQEFTPDELLSILNEIGFSTDNRDVYGQRQRRMIRNLLLRKIIHKLWGNPDESTSPKLRPIRNKVPRYFTIIATKSSDQPSTII
jgi:SAM-dependent methyltransferase